MAQGLKREADAIGLGKMAGQPYGPNGFNKGFDFPAN
jgi:hypothetical protein